MTSKESLDRLCAADVSSAPGLAPVTRSRFSLRQAGILLLGAAMIPAFLHAQAQPDISKAKSKKQPAAKADNTAVDKGGDDAKAGKDGAKKQTAYDFGLPSEDGKNIPLDTYKGKVLLIVNLGRDSSYASQLAGLEKLSQQYKDKGLVVIGVPSNDFGDAEPGTDAKVAKAYADAKVDFLITARSTLTGVHELPLFGYLSKNKAVHDDGLHWNYTKFLVDRKGNVIMRFAPDVAPDSLDMKAPLQEVLDGTWKPVKPKSKIDEASAQDDDPDA